MGLSTTTLARGSARRPWLTVGIWVLALLGAGAIIAFVLPGSLTAQYSFLGRPDSKTGQELLARKLDMPQKANEVVIVRSRTATINDPAFRAAVVALQAKLTALGPASSMASPATTRAAARPSPRPTDTAPSSPS